MAILLAVFSTIVISLGELIAEEETKRARSEEVTSAMFTSGFVMAGIAALWWRGSPTLGDLVLGGLAGVMNGVGILFLYAAYSRGSLRSAAPAAAVVMTSIPVLWDVVAGSASPSTLAWTGIVIGIAAIALSSYQPRASASSEATDRGLWPAILAGCAFGVLFIFLAQISNDAGGAPIVMQRLVGLIVAVLVTRATGPCIYPADPRVRRMSWVVGLFATAAVILIFLALQLGGSLATVSVIASQYAAVAVLLGVVFRGQRLWWWQAVGLAGASVAVGLITLG